DVFLFSAMPFELTDKQTSADIGLVVTGHNLNELFSDAAIGLTTIMADINNLNESRQFSLKLEGENIEELFFKWLSEIIYYKDAEKFLFKRCELEFTDEYGIVLTAQVYGDTIDPQRHTLKIDIKGVTYYKFRVENSGKLWRSEVVFDL
ncbi:MAG: archease, partial [candidate division Zixibacteria bacterium]|nr:archease [candidate division Zixibacteria bacterium]